jgi:hypothetical protein
MTDLAPALATDNDLAPALGTPTVDGIPGHLLAKNEYGDWITYYYGGKVPKLDLAIARVKVDGKYRITAHDCSEEYLVLNSAYKGHLGRFEVGTDPNGRRIYEWSAKQFPGLVSALKKRYENGPWASDTGRSEDLRADQAHSLYTSVFESLHIEAPDL